MEKRNLEDGRDAFRYAQDVFSDLYGEIGANAPKAHSLRYDENKKVWHIVISFFRLLASLRRSYYLISIRQDGFVLRIKRYKPALLFLSF